MLFLFYCGPDQFSVSMLFIIVGMIGEYIAVLFKEVKGRHIYIVEKEYTKRRFEKQVPQAVMV